MQAYFWGRATAIAAIMDFKSRGRLGIVESATKGVGLGKSNIAATINRDSGKNAAGILTCPQKVSALQATNNIIIYYIN